MSDDEADVVGGRTLLEQAAAHIGNAGYTAYTMTLVGNPAPKVTAYYQRVRDPQAGDLVVETSTFYARERKGYGHIAVGTLRGRDMETITVEDDDGPFTFVEEAWYVEPYAGGDVVRWTNAEFVSIPRDHGQALEWQGRRVG